MGDTSRYLITNEWCKCDDCWQHFIDMHPGEDLNEIAQDRSWWSGLPEHKDYIDAWSN